MKLLIVFGTRPEAIKMAPVVLALTAAEGIEVRVCVTAQHREMLDQVLDIFAIKPDYDLDLMQANQDLFDITSRALLGMRDVMRAENFDRVLVHGDTTTCMAAGLASFYEGVPLAHVEAGLRTGNLQAPFPEEANRSIVGRIADLHFAPTESSRLNLLAENVPKSAIHVTGNTVIDALMLAREKTARLAPNFLQETFSDDYLQQLAACSRHILITGHRRENFGEGFVSLCSAIRELALAHPDWLLTYPVHLNPQVQKPVSEILAGLDNVHLIKPQDYLPFVWLMDNSSLILTDSGGIQEEGPSLGKPVLVMREVTERPEAVDAGTVRLVGTNKSLIIDAVEEVLGDQQVYEAMARATNPYGDGRAAERIVSVLQHAS